MGIHISLTYVQLKLISDSYVKENNSYLMSLTFAYLILCYNQAHV